MPEVGLLIPCFVPKGGFLYTMIFSGGEFLLPSSRVPGGMVMDEIDTCITLVYMGYSGYLVYMGGGQKSPLSNSDI